MSSVESCERHYGCNCQNSSSEASTLFGLSGTGGSPCGPPGRMRGNNRSDDWGGDKVCGSTRAFWLYSRGTLGTL